MLLEFVGGIAVIGFHIQARAKLPLLCVPTSDTKKDLIRFRNPAPEDGGVRSFQRIGCLLVPRKQTSEPLPYDAGRAHSFFLVFVIVAAQFVLFGLLCVRLDTVY